MTATTGSGVSANGATTSVAVALTALLTLGVAHYDTGPGYSHVAVTTAVAVVLGCMLVATIGLRFEDGRRETLVRLISSVAALCAGVVLALLAVFDGSTFAIIVISLAMLVVYALACVVLLGATDSTPGPKRGRQGASGI